MKRRNFLKSLAGLAAGMYAAPFLPSFALPPPTSGRIHASPARIDELSLKHWYRVENQPIQFYDVAGQTEFPFYTSSGGLSTCTVSYLYKGELPINFEALPFGTGKPFQVATFERGAYALVEWDHHTSPEEHQAIIDSAADALRKV